MIKNLIKTTFKSSYSLFFYILPPGIGHTREEQASKDGDLRDGEAEEAPVFEKTPIVLGLRHLQRLL
jgi:hypothetical protein